MDCPHERGPPFVVEDDDNAGGEQVVIIMPVFASAKRVILLVFTLSFTELLNSILVQMKSSLTAILQN